MDGGTADELGPLIERVRSCSACANYLPLGPRPVLQLSKSATLLIASQAPGTKAHASGIPFSDASGDQLRRWMGISDEQFYDAARVAIVPMALCYPGRASGGGDAPPRPECSTLWREPLLAQLPHLQLTLLVGTYAQEHVLGSGRMADRVRHFDRYLPRHFPLPHPSWRSRGWMTKNPWFEENVLPELRWQVSNALGPGHSGLRPNGA
ncbi:uracil-DNA glycosylase [Arthrobacter sp. TPD3018]|jgi:uracil-DNA glycosylase|uniref:Uracil-DNA glycosylase family protein n=2 Tax=Sphingomonadales TaxID=204457 RepID=A0A558RDJ7_9SPHN|nr:MULTISPECIES: uracil-DNA glycosylase family protein [Bacteria]MBI0477391.1 uracil-DNA glycosylase family protein [Sphingomonas sp. MA1305]MCP8892942.1 uracil-DNA glycosylase family protein [Sphingomonas faeni]PVE50374.1 uracil-DNA glycosylase [Sphingomonas sp. TPD3009]PVE50732.1 uracil-DNA glycosylase [Arthrobacter sp. TPD3018]PVE80240.1 uracil-DNA glycosylase [Sphingomonas melonis]